MKRDNFTYYFKEESVTLEIPGKRITSYVSFNCYSLQSRKKFKDFKQELAQSGPREYNNINDIYGLATRHGIRATNGSKPTITDTLAF